MTTPLIFVITDVMWCFTLEHYGRNAILNLFSFPSKIIPMENVIACAWCSYESHTQKKTWDFCIPSTSKLTKLQWIRNRSYFTQATYVFWYRTIFYLFQWKLLSHSKNFEYLPLWIDFDSVAAFDVTKQYICILRLFGNSKNSTAIVKYISMQISIFVWMQTIHLS